MERLEQILGALGATFKSDGNWLFENQRREREAHDERLAAAEGALLRALEFIRGERQRLGLVVQAQPPAELSSQRVRAVEAMRQRTNSGEQKDGRSAAQ